eukprot:TRINITY_DN20112_c3_g1_i1.p1 TRINITY_DN20112_c3_g1~~TRINITY_DN20112_c3_g1_i1.p1  ORF type:complete len:446 (-),score=48.03 TRINITY_DN20112_c3_g1_i1:127-1332(-)
MLLRTILDLRVDASIQRMACTSQGLRAMVEAVTRSAVLETLSHTLAAEARKAAQQSLAEGCSYPWHAHWILLAEVVDEPFVLQELANAIWAPDSAFLALQRSNPLRRQIAKLALKAITSKQSVARSVLSTGPSRMLPLQRRLLRRLGMEAGAIQESIKLALLTADKAENTESEAAAFLDVAEICNLMAYARTYVSRSSKATAQLMVALTRARHVSTGSCAHEPRSLRLYGRTLVSAAHSWLLDCCDDDTSLLLSKLFGSGQHMFDRAIQTLQSGVEAAERMVELDPSRASILELGSCLASLGECWFCVASVEHRFADGPTEAEAIAKSREWFEQALRVLSEAGYGQSLEYADALKDYGKLVAHFDTDSAFPDALNTSLAVHRRLLGDDHPRTRNVRRLMNL